MDKMSISEVSKRRRSLSTKKKKKDISLLLNKEKLTLKEAQEVIENFESISNDQIYAFERVLDIFKESYRNEYTCKNDLELQRLCNTVCDIMPRLETVDNPVRDMIMTQTREVRNFAKRAMRNAKTYAQRAINPYDGSISDKTYDNHKKDTKDMPDGYTVKTLKDLPTKDSFNVSTQSSPSPGKVEECYNQIQETAKRISICDRVLYNHEKMCRRFNLNEVVEDSKDFEMCVYELCNLIDSYDMPFDIKYNVALENILYLFDLNKKYVDENPKEYIDEFFYTRDITPQNLLFMESIRYESPFYLENDKSISESTTNEFSYIIEASKENPVKKIIDDFKKDSNKSDSKIKMVINRIYTKTPEQIIDGTPNFLAWIRNLLLLSAFGTNVILGALVFFTDKMISMHLKRTEIEKVLKDYDSEMKKVQSKIDKTNSKENKENLSKYYEKLEKERKVLKEYRDSLRTEKELEDEWQDDFDFDFDFDESACLAEGIFDKITIGTELDEVKKKIRFEFKRVLERLKVASNNKFKKYFDKGYFRFIPDAEIEDFLNFDEELGRYLDAGGNICMNFCYCNFEKLFESDNETDYFKIIQELCDFCQVGVSDKVSISYEGTGGNMYLIFTYLEPLYIEADLRDEIRESYFHPMTYGSLGTIYSISESMEVFNNYPKEEFINNINESYFNSLEVKTMINYLNESSLFSIDESIDILMNIRNNSTDIESQNIKYLVDNYIKESVNIKEKEFDPLTYKEDVDMYVAVYEALADKVKNKTKELSKKAGVKANNLKDNIAKKGTTAAITAKLGVQAAKKNVKELDAKQQKLSKDMDNMVSSMYRRIEQAAVTKNREQIIKGSVLPSASKIVKMAITFGGAYLINPAIAAIGALSMLFMSKNATKKERALILDELDIELRIVERKISRAEAEDDDDLVRDLYKIQNKLLREKQRLKYRMNVYYHQKPTAGASSKERIDD